MIEGEDNLYPTALGLADPEDDESEDPEADRVEAVASAMKHYEIDYAKVLINQNESVSD